MRFAWQRNRFGSKTSITESGLARVVMFAYNAVWWVPVILVLARIINYQAGFIFFFTITFVRAAANLYRNNALTREQAEIFPFRSP